MFKFFRRIRLNLLSEGKTTKYFKYALGEIVLVVIGILIALQINNWNENQKLKTLKEKYTLALINDLEADIVHFDSQINQLEKQLFQIDSLSGIMREPTATLVTYERIFRENKALPYIIEDTNLNNSTIKTLQNSGHLTLFEEDLENALLQMLFSQYEYTDYISEIISFRTQNILRLVDEVPIALPGSIFRLNDNLETQLWDEVDWPNARRQFYNNLQIASALDEQSLDLIKKAKSRTDKLKQQLENSQ